MRKKGKFVPGSIKILFFLLLIVLIASVAFMMSKNLQDRILRRKVQNKTQEIKHGESFYSKQAERIESNMSGKSQTIPAKEGSLILDQQALNDYITVHYSDVIPKEIKEWAVELSEDAVTLYLLVDLSAYTESIEAETGSMAADMIGEGIGLIIEGKLTGEDGKGILRVEKIYLGAIPLPLGLIYRVVEREVEMHGEEPLEDIFSLPFLLPEDYRSLQVREGWVILEK